MLELILFGLLTYGFTAVLWCGLICLSFTNTRWRWIGHSAAQVSALVVCFELLQMDGVDAVLLALAPPLYVIIFEDQFLRLLPFFGPLLPYATLIGIGVAIMLGPRRFGVWLLFPSVAAAGLALLIMGEFRSKAEMCRTADVTSFHRNTLFWSRKRCPDHTLTA